MDFVALGATVLALDEPENNRRVLFVAFRPAPADSGMRLSMPMRGVGSVDPALDERECPLYALGGAGGMVDV